MSKNIRVFKKRLQISQKKWNTVQAQSLRTVNTIMNILSRLNLMQRSDAFSKTLLDKFHDIPERLAFHLIEIINKSITDLSTFLHLFENCVKEMRKIEEQFRLDFSLMAKKQLMERTDDYHHDLEILEQAERTIQEIVDMYETELTLRKQIVEEITDSISLQPSIITSYLVLWSSEVYIEPSRIHELIEEFTCVEKVNQSQRQSQDSFGYVGIRRKP